MALITACANPYDSDNEPLITSPIASDLDEDALLHFTATGRPLPKFKQSGLISLGGDMYTMPQYLPKRYTDDSIIPAIVTEIIPRAVVEEAPKKKKKGILGKLKVKKEGGEGKDGKGIMKVVYMPRRDYQRFFAKDNKGVYIGSEPYRRWTEEELDEAYGKYKPEPKKKGYRAPV